MDVLGGDKHCEGKRSRISFSTKGKSGKAFLKGRQLSRNQKELGELNMQFPGRSMFQAEKEHKSESHEVRMFFLSLKNK